MRRILTKQRSFCKKFAKKQSSQPRRIPNDPSISVSKNTKNLKESFNDNSLSGLLSEF
jgi:hypothetical protein